MPDETTEKVLDLIAATKRIPRESVSINSTFEELGMDSLDAINLMYEIESTFNISVPDEAVKSVANVRQLMEKLKAVLAEVPQTPSGSPEQ
jgi:acyl carrier protein